MNSYVVHYTDGETETQTSKVICSGKHSRQGIVLGLEAKNAK